MVDECLFCGIVSGAVPSVRVAEDTATYAFMDINPGSDGHLLVVPNGTAGICSTYPPTTSPPSR
ncbi:Hypothetical histidine triad (HIT) protein [Mycobacteroides abscessus]|nr:Hypothetical histidine triad (HIT) protein [Mycobacteroides abscessus]